MRGPRIAVRFLIRNSLLLMPWMAGSALAYTTAAETTTGPATAALSGALAPPAAIGFAYALRGALRWALRRAEGHISEAMARREDEALLRDPDLLESLAQMARGEGTIARTSNEEEADR
jgi:hypothetical protein